MKVTVVEGRLTKSTVSAACWDIYSTEDVLLPPHSFAVVGTGLKTVMEGCSALILDRSGLAARYGVSRRAGVIDSDYRDEWKVVVHNEGREAYQIKRGDRIAQVLFAPHFDITVEGDGAEQLGVERVGGLGSTGR
jgi:dUTP pyrophosphatase